MTKEIYFIITYPRDSEENEKDIYFEKKSIKPKCIFVQCDALKKKYVYPDKSVVSIKPSLELENW